ncbi:MAG: carbamoyl-phosphate synthase large subunit [Solirubrobacteraceae bacterium]
MGRRSDIHKIMILGSGPIVIGQAAEFDYSGVQACKVLREEGYEIVLVNSNPATIMTDPELADATYVEPLLPEYVGRVIERERPDALLPTLGGQTALNLARDLHEDGLLDRLCVELIGADYEAIGCAEDRELFRAAMEGAGLAMPRSAVVSSVEQALAHLPELGLPCIVRPAFTLGGRGGGIARSEPELERIVAHGLEVSPIGQVLLDQSVLGWGEFELEVMRDGRDNALVVCSIENVDPMGVHTGDSLTVAPQQTLSDRLYQRLRDQALAVIRAVGVETGGSNVQFAVNPATEEILVIEMNPRVSRSSALASKATGFPIAKIAARLAVGYALDEILNDITGATPASFEPTIDYVVVKYPRFAFEKFPGAEDTLTTHMKSVGEVMALGRTFAQAFAKAMRSRELDKESGVGRREDAELLAGLEAPHTDRYEAILELFSRGVDISQVHDRTAIHPWFLQELHALARDPQAPFAGERCYRSVDTCAAEFPARTPYYYSAWERTAEHEVQTGENPSVVVLGAGPNRIGQGIEFDYCCVHAAMTVRESGREAVMINCNPETVSTDYDISDRLYFEPLTLEDVLAALDMERNLEGVIVQFGGQTPLKLAAGLKEAGVPLLGTSVESIDLAEDRGRFGDLLSRLGYRAPPFATAHSVDEALAEGNRVGYPLLVRPSYVLGGRAMEIVYSQEGLADYLRREVPGRSGAIYLDSFLERAIEVDVDALCDSGADNPDAGPDNVWIAGIMQHVEEAGVHSGDSACVLPPHSLDEAMIEQIRQATRDIALAIGVVGLLNIQYAVHEGTLYVIEANPRASRTVPFVSKAVGLPLAKLACRIMLGTPLSELGLPREREGLGFGSHVSVKEAVLPFDRLAGADALLGPEMRSTGEVMGIAHDFPSAFAKAQAAAGVPLPTEGAAFVSVTDSDKEAAAMIAQTLHDNGFALCATHGTADAIARMGVPVERLRKLAEGSPHVVDRIDSGEVALVINTPSGSGARSDGWEIRRAAVARGIPCLTTLPAAASAVRAITRERAVARGDGVPGGHVVSLQELHRSGPPDPCASAGPLRAAATDAPQSAAPVPR